jgi:hypothetical protein
MGQEFFAGDGASNSKKGEGQWQDKQTTVGAFVASNRQGLPWLIGRKQKAVASIQPQSQ